jgi:hypothetical protein
VTALWEPPAVTERHGFVNCKLLPGTALHNSFRISYPSDIGTSLQPLTMSAKATPVKFVKGVCLCDTTSITTITNMHSRTGTQVLHGRVGSRAEVSRHWSDRDDSSCVFSGLEDVD